MAKKVWDLCLYEKLNNTCQVKIYYPLPGVQVTYGDGLEVKAIKFIDEEYMSEWEICKVIGLPHSKKRKEYYEAKKEFEDKRCKTEISLVLTWYRRTSAKKCRIYMQD